MVISKRESKEEALPKNLIIIIIIKNNSSNLYEWLTLTNSFSREVVHKTSFIEQSS